MAVTSQRRAASLGKVEVTRAAPETTAPRTGTVMDLSPARVTLAGWWLALA